jgi:prepilin-type N-terminal cleavage/methylation domain-containing protein
MRRGTTLIELLIAITLVSLLSAGMLIAMRVGLNAMERTNDNLTANRKRAGAQAILEQQVAAFMPVMGDCLPSMSGPPMTIRFFQGEPQSMRFISMYSLEEAHRGAPRLLELQVIPGDQGQGLRLIVNEHPYAWPRSTLGFCLGLLPDPRFPPIVPGPRSFVLADRLHGCRFAYQERLPEPALARWLPRWIRQDDWPNAIRIDMPPYPSLVLPVRARKDPTVRYEDY